VLRERLICGRLGESPRCPAHTIATKPRSGTYTRDAKAIVAAADRCWLCGEGPRPDDPFVAHHVIPRLHGGTDDPSNLAPAHRSCNGRRGAKLAGHPGGDQRS
jgi:hypothetical protein